MELREAVKDISGVSGCADPEFSALDTFLDADYNSYNFFGTYVRMSRTRPEMNRPGITAQPDCGSSEYGNRGFRKTAPLCSRERLRTDYITGFDRFSQEEYGRKKGRFSTARG